MIQQEIDFLYCEDLVRIEYYDPETRLWNVMTNDSVTQTNGFLGNFTAVSTLAGGFQKTKLRVYNIGIPESLDFIIFKFDFSESFAYSDEGFSYDNISNSDVYNSVTTELRTGPQNQDGLQNSFVISSDIHAANDESKIAVMFSRNQKINSQSFYPTKLAVIPYMPSLHSYIPMELTLTLNRETINKLEQKRVSVVVPQSFSGFNTSTSYLQQKLFSSSEYNNFFSNSENFKAQYPRTLGYYFNNSLFTESAGSVIFPLYVHSLQYYANVATKYRKDEFQYGNYIFETVFPQQDIFTYGSFPKNVSIGTSSSTLSSENVTFSGYEEYREIPEVMTEVLSFTKHVFNSFKSGPDSSYFRARIDTLDAILNNLVDNICSMLGTTNYVQYSGREVNSTEKFFFNVFVRSLLYFVDYLRRESNYNATDGNKVHYEDLWRHAGCLDCRNKVYCFDLLEDLISKHVNRSPRYVTMSMLLLDFFRYVEDTYDTFNENRGMLARIKGNFYPMAAKLNQLIDSTYYFDPNQETTGSEFLDEKEEFPYISLYLGLIDEAMGEDRTSRRQVWHTVQKHFRTSAIPSDSLSMITENSYLNVDLRDDTTYDLQTFLQILADVDIISMNLYTILDNLYIKQKSTTLSFKMNITNY